MNKNIRKIIVYYTDGTYSEIQSASAVDIKPVVPVVNPSITKCHVCGFPGGHGGLACPTLTSYSVVSSNSASNVVVPTPDELKNTYSQLKNR